MPHSNRKPSVSDLDLITYNRLFREILGRGRVPVGPSAVAEDRRHLKTLRQRIPDDNLRDAFVREYLNENSRFLDERDYPLRYAVMAERYTILFKQAQAAVAPPPPDPEPEPRLSDEVLARDRERMRQRMVAEQERLAAHRAEVKAGPRPRFARRG